VTVDLVEQPGVALDAGEGVQFHSFSSLNQLLNICSLQFYLERILRLPKERVSAALVLGSAVDKALRAIVADLVKGRAPSGAHALQVLRAHLETPFGDRSVPVVSTKDESLEDLYDLGKRMIEKYLSILPQDEAPLDLPTRFIVPLIAENGEALPRPLKGELDSWVRTSDGRVGISDWKTAAARWPADKLAKDEQATAYLIAGEHILGKEPAFFRYVLLLKTKKPEVETYYVSRGASDRRRFLKKARMADRIVEAGTFVPNDHSFACATCAVRGACEKWQD
jgi:putative RecB family exonuclease